MKVSCVWSDNGPGEAPSLVAICATPEAAERERAADPFGSAWTVDEWDVVDEPAELTGDQLAKLAFVRDAWGAYMSSPLPDPDPDGVIRVQLAAGLTLSIPLGG